MGWRGAIRSVQSSIRAAQREAERQQKARIRLAAQLEKDAVLTEAAEEVREHQAYVSCLVESHREIIRSIDWKSIMEARPPEKPTPDYSDVILAEERLDGYAPGVVAKLLRRVDKEKEELAAAVRNARASVEERHRKALEEFRAAVSDVEDSRAFAIRILNGDLSAYRQAIAELDPFSILAETGGKVSIDFPNEYLAVAALSVSAKEVLPTETKSLLKSGKLSTKRLSISRFNALHLDHVCSTTLRIAGDLFAILPIRFVVLTAFDDLLDASTGHLKNSAILSVAIPRDTFSKLNPLHLVASDSMSNFVHRVDFKKSRGFAGISPLDPGQFGKA
jgi:hypothetical protein